jgi:hypothetical protein
MGVKEILHQLGVGCFGLSSIRKVGFESYGFLLIHMIQENQIIHPANPSNPLNPAHMCFLNIRFV